MTGIEKPINRSKLRIKLGILYYSFLRHVLWIKMKKLFAIKKSDKNLLFVGYSHKTILLREFRDMDMWIQHNKVINLQIAAKQLNCVVLKSGEVFSCWKLIGKPTKQKGYVDGMILQEGKVTEGIGGGLCQMSNLIFWITLHTPLTVVERHRHGYDVFPDSSRKQPFGSGATCFYPHRDLMIRNDTKDVYQLVVNVGDEFLEGQWRVSSLLEHKYEIIEKNHEMRGEYWGGYIRCNELYQQIVDLEGKLIDERKIIENSAIMMYSPLLSKQGQ